MILDGFENEDYFHFIFGWGGHLNGYYYLFPSDTDTEYDPRPYINLWDINAAFDIYPDCPSSEDVSYSTIFVSNGEGQFLQSGNNLYINDLIIDNGGRAVLRADNEIIINNNLEVEIGGEILIESKPCIFE